MTSRKKRRDDTKGAGYLPFLKGPPIKSEGDAPGWYACMSNGFQALCAERDAKRDLMVAMLGEPERARQQTLAWLMADAPSPSRSRH